MNVQKFAQKGVVFNEKGEILLIKYSGGKYMADKIAGKYALPGGRIEMGEIPDNALVREVKEETGIDCIPGLPLYCWNWEYRKDDDLVQINAVARVCRFSGGAPSPAREEAESSIEGCYWIDKEKVLTLEIVGDERPALEQLIKNYSFYTGAF